MHLKFENLKSGHQKSGHQKFCIQSLTSQKFYVQSFLFKNFLSKVKHPKSFGFIQRSIVINRKWCGVAECLSFGMCAPHSSWQCIKANSSTESIAIHPISAVQGDACLLNHFPIVRCENERKRSKCVLMIQMRR